MEEHNYNLGIKNHNELLFKTELYIDHALS